MADKKPQLPLLQSLRLHARAFAFLYRQVPMVFLSTTVLAAIVAVRPYVTIYFSARIIDELSGNRDPQRLMMWILLALGSALVLSLLRAIVQKWKNTRNVAWWFHEQLIYTRKWLDMDYCDVESAETGKLYD